MKTRWLATSSRQQLLTGCHHGVYHREHNDRQTLRRGASIVGFAGFVTLSLAGTESLMEEVVHSTGVTMEQRHCLLDSGNYIRAELEEDRKKRVEEWEKEVRVLVLQHFLQSPTRHSSHGGANAWTDKDAGLDYVGTCGEYTDALMACTSEHASYFEAEAAEAEKERGKDKDK